MLSHKRRRFLTGLCVLAALVLLSQGSWIQAKAQVAQWLLQSAWEQTRQDGMNHKAWPWADHWPVASLKVPARAIEQIVLEGDGGNVLAFAPGHNARSALPGGHGPIVLSGHRDTHFSYLRDLEAGDRLELETVSGTASYFVTGARVVDARAIRIDVNAVGNPLLLVTCYPFDALVPGGFLRYVVAAMPAVETR
jgi:sortase A